MFLHATRRSLCIRRSVDTRGLARTLCIVANKSSEARDHLANERTFLAWARTGMAFVGLGVAADQASATCDSPLPLG